MGMNNTEQSRSISDVVKFDDTVNIVGDLLKRADEFNHLDNDSRFIFAETMHLLAMTCESKSNSIEAHLKRVGIYSKQIARLTGLSSEEQSLVEILSTVHDIGNICIPTRIVKKSGALNWDEFSYIKLHTTTGGWLLRKAKSPFLVLAREVALFHHENWDGNGYPIGLKNQQIPLFSRIVSLADTFDALCSERPHKKAYPADAVADLLKKESGKKFEPQLVSVFVDNFDTFIELHKSLNDRSITTDWVLSGRDTNTFPCQQN